MNKLHLLFRCEHVGLELSQPNILLQRHHLFSTFWLGLVPFAFVFLILSS